MQCKLALRSSPVLYSSISVHVVLCFIYVAVYEETPSQYQSHYRLANGY